MNNKLSILMIAVIGANGDTLVDRSEYAGSWGGGVFVVGTIQPSFDIESGAREVDERYALHISDASGASLYYKIPLFDCYPNCVEYDFKATEEMVSLEDGLLTISFHGKNEKLKRRLVLSGIWVDQARLVSGTMFVYENEKLIDAWPARFGRGPDVEQ